VWCRGSGRRAARARLLLLALAMSGCAGDGRFARHGHGDVWAGALRYQVREPRRLVPEATLLATTLALIPLDDEVQDAIGSNTRDPGDDASDYLRLALWGAPVVWGGISWARGDEARKFEVSVEAIGTAVLVTRLLKETTGRWRPDRLADNSFPSAHAASAFAGATLLANFIEQESESKLGYLFYLPAAYVGIERIHDNRHWATDVAAAAFLGTFFANLFFDAHYGSGEGRHPGIFEPEPRVRMTVAPMLGERATGVVLRLDF
jgi:membrane-associated phospholipid phosphatase